MFSLFKKKPKIEKMRERYNHLMSEWHRLSTVNRTKSDQLYSEAQELLLKIEALEDDAQA